MVIFPPVNTKGLGLGEAAFASLLIILE